MVHVRIVSIGAIAIFFIAFSIFDSNGSTLKRFRRIIGGSNAVPKEFPWQVSLRRNGKHICGGAIISDRHILTAAHCIHGVVKPPYKDLTVVTGMTNVDESSDIHIVKDVKVVDSYVPRADTTLMKNDIAVIGLTENIKMNEFQKEIALPKSDVPKNTVAFVSGFGLMDLFGVRKVTNLQKLEVSITKGTDCLAGGVRVQANQICSINKPGTCVFKGDSGGPLVSQNHIIGVVSSAATCDMDHPAVYTNIFSFLDFIRKAMASI